MADESMVRTLAAQAEAIWPQERGLLAALDLPREARVLDVACGTGEWIARLAAERPRDRMVGVDLHEPHLERARTRCAEHGPRVRFESGDAFALAAATDSVDLCACRHVLQAVPEPWLVLAELVRVTRPGGWVHLVAEDYGLILSEPCTVDSDRFWRSGPITLGERTGTDLRGGRKAFHGLRRLGLQEIRVHYVVLDTLRVPRPLLVRIFEAWRDGYTELIAQHTDLAEDEVRRSFDAVLAAFRDPDGYGAWLVPVIQGRVP
jgi:ubiquinone/menaquinone biosynthesis C-methylase UbiE